MMKTNDKYFKQQELSRRRREIDRFAKQKGKFKQQEVFESREQRRHNGNPLPPPPQERTIEEMNEEMRKLGIENKPWDNEMDL